MTMKTEELLDAISELDPKYSYASSAAYYGPSSGQPVRRALLAAALIILGVSAAIAGGLFAASRMGILPQDTESGENPAAMPADPEDGTTSEITSFTSRHRTTYVWCKEGFGGKFMISLYDDGTYGYMEGILSSYYGTGTWTNENGFITLKKHKVDSDEDRVFRFRLTGNDGMVFIADGSDNFTYVHVADGDRFFPFSANYSSNEDEELRRKSKEDFAYLLEKNGGVYTDADGTVRKLEKTSGILVTKDGTDITFWDSTPGITEGVGFRLISFLTSDHGSCHIFYVSDGEIRSMLGEIGGMISCGLWDYDGNGTDDLVICYRTVQLEGGMMQRIAVVDFCDWSVRELTSDAFTGVYNRPFPYVWDGVLYIDGEKVTWTGSGFEWKRD